MFIEKHMLGWAESVLGCGAYVSAPSPLPTEFVTVERAGGSTELGIDRPLMAVQCWADSVERAAEMAQALRRSAVSGGLLSREGVYSAQVSGCYSFPDPDSRKPRYQFSVSLVTTSE